MLFGKQYFTLTMNVFITVVPTVINAIAYLVYINTNSIVANKIVLWAC